MKTRVEADAWLDEIVAVMRGAAMPVRDMSHAKLARLGIDAEPGSDQSAWLYVDRGRIAAAALMEMLARNPGIVEENARRAVRERGAAGVTVAEVAAEVPQVLLLPFEERLARLKATLSPAGEALQ
jgi:hypothetical protein